MRIALLACLWVAASPAVTSAQARSVAIAPLSGRGAAPARRALGRALEGHGYTVSLAEDDPGDDPEATARLAEGASADAVVGGRVSRRGQVWRFTLWIRDRTGGPQGDVQQRARGERGVSRVADRVHEALQRVPTSSSLPPDVSEPGPPPTASEPSSGAQADSAPPPAAPSRAPTSTRSDSGDDDAFPITGSLEVGAGVRSRSFELLAPDGVDAAYRAEPYFEIAARGSARFFDIAFVRARFGSSVALTSDREVPDLGQVESHFFRLSGDVGASYWIDDVVELGAAFGVGWDRYELAFNELVPTTEYVHLRPALVSAVRLAGRALVIDAELGVRIPLGVGDLTALHGVDYQVLGADALLRVHGVIDPGLVWTVEGGVRRYWLGFDRPDGRVTGHDGGWQATAYIGWQL